MQTSLSPSLPTPLTFSRPPNSVFSDTHNYLFPLHRKAASQWLQMTHSLLHNSMCLTPPPKWTIGNHPSKRGWIGYCMKNACHSKDDSLPLIQHLYRNSLCLILEESFFLFMKKGKISVPLGYQEAHWKNRLSVNKGWKFCSKSLFPDNAASNDCGFGVGARGRRCCVSQ